MSDVMLCYVAAAMRGKSGLKHNDTVIIQLGISGKHAGKI
jgi:hypothetical protein